jgi:hypothetical protein
MNSTNTPPQKLRTKEKAGINLQLEGNKWQELIVKANQTPKVIKGEKQVENPDK